MPVETDAPETAQEKPAPKKAPAKKATAKKATTKKAAPKTEPKAEIAANLRFERKAFVDAINFVSRISAGRGILVEHNFLEIATDGDDVLVRGTNGTTEGIAKVNADKVEAIHPGSILLPTAMAADLAKRLPDAAVVLEDAPGESGRMTALVAGGYRARVRVVDDPPPRLTDPEEVVASATISASEFVRAATATGAAASTDSARPVLTGVLLTVDDTVSMTATDSYRLHEAISNPDGAEGKAQGLIPADALAQTSRLLGNDPEGTVRVALSPGSARFELPGYTVTTRLIEGKYPDVGQLWPKEKSTERTLTVNGKDLSEVVKRIAVIGSGEAKTPVTLQLDADRVTVRSGSGETGDAEEALSAVLAGADLNIAFNPRFLLGAIDALGTPEELSIELRDEVKPAVLRIGAIRTLVMPIRL